MSMEKQSAINLIKYKFIQR